MPDTCSALLLCCSARPLPSAKRRPQEACKANVYRVTSPRQETFPILHSAFSSPLLFPPPVPQNRMTKHRIRDTQGVCECADKNRTLDPTRLVAGLPCVDSADWPVRDDDGCSPLEKLQRWRMGLARSGRRDGLYSALPTLLYSTSGAGLGFCWSILLAGALLEPGAVMRREERGGERRGDSPQWRWGQLEYSTHCSVTSWTLATLPFAPWRRTQALGSENKHLPLHPSSPLTRRDFSVRVLLPSICRRT